MEETEDAEGQESLRRSAAMLKEICKIGGGKIAAMLAQIGMEGTGLPKLTASQRHFLTGPIICHNGGGWGPEWDGHPCHEKIFPAQVYAERIDAAFGLSPFSVGPTEIMLVMYGATMAAPLGSSLTELYIWAASKALATSTGQSLEDVYARLGDGKNVKHITDDEVLHKEPWASHYREISYDVIKKVSNCAQARQRHSSRPSNLDELVTEAVDLDSLSGKMAAD